MWLTVLSNSNSVSPPLFAGRFPMRGAAFATLAAIHIQFVSLLSQVSIPWPTEWRNIIRVVQLINFDPRDLIGHYNLPPVTFHTLFILIANFLPFAIILLGLVLFQPLYVIVWYALTSFGLVVLAAGLVITFQNNDPNGTWIAVGGGALLLVCFIIGVTAYLLRSESERADDDAYKDEQIKQREEARKFSGIRSLKFFILAVGCFFGGCALTGLLIPLPFSNRQSGPLRIVGFCLFVLFLIFFLYLTLTLTETGREWLRRFERSLKAKMLAVVLLLISVVYMPTINYTVNSFMCATYECPAGTVFNPRAKRTEYDWSRSPDKFCDPCVFLDQRCRGGSATTTTTIAPSTTDVPSPNGTLAVTGTPAPFFDTNPNAVCPAFSSVRVWQHPEAACNDATQHLYYASSSLIIFVFVCALPALYVKLVRKLTKYIARDAALIPEADENLEFVPPVEQYQRKVYACEPAAASLYQPFTVHHKYFQIALQLFQIVIVLLTTVVAAFSTFGALFSLVGFHLIAVVALLLQKPFSNSIEQHFAVGLEVCAILDTTYAIVLQFNVQGIPSWVPFVILGINVGVPIITAALTFLLVRRRGRKKAVGEGEKKADDGHPVDYTQKAIAMRRHCDSMVNQQFNPAFLPQGHNFDEIGTLGKRQSTLHEEELALLTPAERERVIEATIKEQGLAGIALPKGHAYTQEECERVRRHNDEIKEAMNRETSKIVTRYFTLMGLVVVTATVCSVVGYLRDNSTPFLDGSTALSRSQAVVLGGYDSQLQMEENCCCVKSVHPAADFNVTERWVCPKRNIVVDRGRISADLADDGTLLRSLCGNTYNFGCRVEVNSSIVSLSCIPEVSDDAWKSRGVTKTARQILF